MKLSNLYGKNIGSDWSSHDEPFEDLWDNVFLQQQFVHTKQEEGPHLALLRMRHPT